MADISKIKLPNNTTYDINATTVNGHTVDKNVPSNAVFTDTDTHRPIQVNGTTILGLTNTKALNLVAGDNVSMTNSGGSVTVSADQIDDTYTYDQYQALPSTTKMQDKIFMVKDAPNPPAIPIVDEYAREQIVDVKSDITELDTSKQNKEWNRIYNTWLKRGASISLPSTKFTELLVLVDYSGNSPASDYCYPMHIPYGYLGHGIIMGYTNGSYVQLKTSATSITLYDIRSGGTQKSGSVVYAYVR